MLSEESVKLCFLVTFNIIISYILPKNFIEIYQVSEDINFYFFDFNYFLSILWIFLFLLATKILMMSASIRYYQQFFGLEFKNCIKLY